MGRLFRPRAQTIYKMRMVCSCPPVPVLPDARCRLPALTVRKQAGSGYSTPFGSAGCFAPPPYTPTSTPSPLFPLLCFRGSYLHGTHLLLVVHPGLSSNATCPKGRNP